MAEKKTEKKEATVSETKETAVSKKFQKLITEIESMTVLELAELVKVLEDKFGVSAQAPMPMAVASSAPAGGVGAGGQAEEKSSYNLELKSVGESKIAIIKLVRDVTGQGLKEAKDLVETAPKVIKEGVAKEEAEKIRKQFEEAGAILELK